MRKLFLILAVGIALLISGCFETNTRIIVKPNGSGTIEQTILMSQQALSSMMGFADADTKSFYDEEKLMEEAKVFGKDVTYVSSEKIDTGEKTGYIAVYSFKDINLLTISDNPAENVMGTPGNNNQDSFKFLFKKGRPAELKILIPEMKDDETEGYEAVEDEAPEIDEAMTDMMMQMYKGMKMNIEIEFDGKITDSNASHKEGNKIVIMHMDFDELAKDPESLKGFQNMQDPNKMKEVLKDIPGIMIETQQEVIVKFK